MKRIPKVSVKPKISGFFDFIRTQGVVGLAVGLVIGNSVKEVVNAIISDLINPVIGLVLGGAGNLKDYKWQVGNAVFAWGHLVSVLIDFVVIAAVVYFVIKGFGFEKLDKKKE